MSKEQSGKGFLFHAGRGWEAQAGRGEGSAGGVRAAGGGEVPMRRPLGTLGLAGIGSWFPRGVTAGLRRVRPAGSPCDSGVVRGLGGHQELLVGVEESERRGARTRVLVAVTAVKWGV